MTTEEYNDKPTGSNDGRTPITFTTYGQHTVEIAADWTDPKTDTAILRAVHRLNILKWKAGK